VRTGSREATPILPYSVQRIAATAAAAAAAAAAATTASLRYQLSLSLSLTLRSLLPTVLSSSSQ
jgi:hypothetical protein